jgi:anti-sigma regulatory factor (Ser/Thr protein kinase)
MSQSVRSAPEAEPTGAEVPPTLSSGPQITDRAQISERAQLLDRRFGRDEITVVRHEVTARLGPAGLTGDRLNGFVLAVNEVVTNVVLHAGGHGRVVLWLAGGSAWCAVTDSGTGIPAKYLASPDVPEAFEVGGRGIWLAYQLCDKVTVATGPIGTTIELRIDLPHRSRVPQNAAHVSGEAPYTRRATRTPS